MNSEIRKYLNVVLEDDCAAFGGTAFDGETVADFIAECNQEFHSVKELNDVLKHCGIKPIATEKSN